MTGIDQLACRLAYQIALDRRATRLCHHAELDRLLNPLGEHWNVERGAKRHDRAKKCDGLPVTVDAGEEEKLQV